MSRERVSRWPTKSDVHAWAVGEAERLARQIIGEGPKGIGFLVLFVGQAVHDGEAGVWTAHGTSLPKDSLIELLLMFARDLYTGEGTARGIGGEAVIPVPPRGEG